MKLVMIEFLFLAIAISLVEATQINVTVGGGPLRYDPEYVTAEPGDVVVFTFKQTNHTVTQSSFADPCQMLDGGFDSGFMPVSSTNTEGPFPAAVLTIQDTSPIWAYCRQTGHCQQGMVFAINPGSNFSAFQAAATSSSNSTSAASSSSTSVAGASATASTTNSVKTDTATIGEPSGTATATYTSSSSSASAVSTDHQVIVGGGPLTYTPSNITAEVGDTVTFVFKQSNHTATQSSFSDPCRELTLTSTTGQIGFDSGFMPVASNATTFPTYTIQVNNTSPVWVYCRQTGHCGQGMVFAVNAVADSANNFSAFQALAEQLNGTSTSSTSSASATSSTSTANSAGFTGSAPSFLLTFVGVILTGLF